MFEQSYFNQEKPEAREPKEGEFLYNYEIKSWIFSPRFYKILALSAIANIAAILIVGQTSLLTMKGCDSPLVNRVCAVLDTVYVGSMIFGTDREYVDQAYEKTDLADADITYVDVTGVTGPIDYPDSFIDMNTNQPVPMFPQAADPMAGFLGPLPTNPMPQNDLFNTPAITPQANPNAVIGGMPTSPLGTSSPPMAVSRPRGGKVKTPKLNNASPDQLPGTGDETANANANANTAGNTAAPTGLTADGKVPELEVNKKPLLDFADSVLTRWSNKEVDLTAKFTVVLNAALTPDGKFDKTKTRWDVAKQQGDQKMIDIAKDAVEAVGDSGFLGYLRKPPFDVEQMTITLVQDDNQITAVISSGQKTAERARMKSSQLNNAITVGKLALKNPSDERTLLDGAKVNADGSNFVINFVIPKQIAQDMITKKLNEARAKKIQGQPSGETQFKEDQHTAKR